MHWLMVAYMQAEQTRLLLMVVQCPKQPERLQS